MKKRVVFRSRMAKEKKKSTSFGRQRGFHAKPRTLATEMPQKRTRRRRVKEPESPEEMRLREEKVLNSMEYKAWLKEKGNEMWSWHQDAVHKAAKVWDLAMEAMQKKNTDEELLGRS